MNANFAINTSTPKAYSAPINHPLNNPPKAYSSGGPQIKQLGGDPALAQWYQEATAWYQAAISGQIQANPADIQQVASYLQWAAQQMGMGPQWDPNLGGTQGLPGQSPMPQEMQYDYESNEIVATGGEVTHRSWGLDDTLVVPSMAASVEYVWTTDDTVVPEKKVLKVIITNQMTGTKEVAIFENADDPDFHLTIKSPKPDTQIKGNAPGIDIETDKYDMEAEKKKSQGGTGGEASVEGTYNSETDEWEYEAASTNDSDKIDFFPVGSDDPEENQVQRVWGPVNITAKPSDKVYVTKDGDGNYVIVVEHKNGSKDTIIAMDGTRSVNINADPKNVYWGDAEISNDYGVPPTGFGDDITVNGGKGVEEMSGGLNALMDELGIDDINKIIDALNQAGIKTADGKSFESVEDVMKAIDDGIFPPDTISSSIVYFLSLIDPKINELAKEAEEVHKSGGDPEPVTSELEERVAELLSLLYGDSKDIKPIDKDDHGPGFTADGVTYALRYDETGLLNWLVMADPEFVVGCDTYEDKGDGWKKTS